LTGEEIKAIILQCAQSKVREIDVPGLRLVFGDVGPAKPLPARPSAFETTSPTDGALSEQEHKANEQQFLLDEEAQTKEEQLALMAIEDPLQFEQLMIRGELNDDSNTKQA